MGLGTRGLKDAWTQESNIIILGMGTWEAETLGLGTWDVGTRGHDKQTTHHFCAEFVNCNFWSSQETYYMLESLSAD